MTAMADRISIVSAERVRDELVKLVLRAGPARRACALLVDTGLADHVLPELPLLALEIDEHHRHKDVYEHTLTVLEQAIDLEEPGAHRTSCCGSPRCMHDVGKPKTRRFEPDGGVSFHHHEVVGAKLTAARMRALRFPKDVVDGRVPAGRAAPALPRLRQRGVDRLRRTPLRHRRRPAAGPPAQADPVGLHHPQPAQGGGRCRAAYDDLEERIARLREQEELDAIRPDLDGDAIMAILGVPPGSAWSGRPGGT